MTEIITTKINTIKIKSNTNEEISLLDIFVTLNIYESIFENFKLGKIIVKDTFDLLSIFPFVGGEELEIYFTSENDDEDQKPKVQTFIVYNIEADDGVHQSESNKKNITLYFCSPEKIIDRKTSISKRWKDTDPNTPLNYILKNIFETKKDFYQHNTKNKLDIITNFWKPSKLISYIENNTIGQFDDFIFYENNKGFNFHSISELMNQPESHKLTFSDTPDMLYSYSNVKGKTMKKYMNDIEGLNFGVYGNTYFKLKPYHYGFTKHQQDFESITEFSTSLGKHLQHRDELINNNSINLTYEDGNHVTKRDIIIKSLSKYHQIIKLNGDSTKTIGQIVEFELDSRVREKIGDRNELLTGKWFITNINHELQGDGTYIQKVKIIKNAFFNFKTFSKAKGRKNL